MVQHELTAPKEEGSQTRIRNLYPAKMSKSEDLDVSPSTSLTSRETLVNHFFFLGLISLN